MEDFMTNLKQEGDNDPFAELEKQAETPTEPSPEKETEKVEPPQQGDEPTAEPVATNTVEEKPLPFHQDPRWNELRNENKQLKETIETVAAQQQQILSRVTPQDAPVIPKWFIDLYGDNQQAWQDFATWDSQRQEQIKQEVYREQAERVSTEQKEEQQWADWVDAEVSKLKAAGNEFDRNELIKTMLEFRPTDESNNYDFQAGLKILQAVKPKVDTTVQTTRKAVGSVEQTTGGGTPAKEYMTSNEARSTSWHKIMQ